MPATVHIYALLCSRSHPAEIKLEKQTQDVKNCVRTLGQGVYKNKSVGSINGGLCGDRTHDLMIKSHPLYQLS